MTEAYLREHVWPRFSRVLSSRNGIYLANHSLGRPLDQTAADVQEGLALWYEQLDDAWNSWPAAMDRFRSNIAELIGRCDPKAVVPKSSAGQGLRAVLNSMQAPINVVSTRGEFDSVDFILKTYEERGLVSVDWVEPWINDDGVPIYHAGNIIDRIVGTTDLVVVSQVFFGTGQILRGLDEVIAAAHSVGARVVVDAYHSAGVIPVEMDVLEADFMIGGSYKYLRGGPGACWLAIGDAMLESDMQTLDTGWFAKREPFGFARAETTERAEGGDGWLESTPAVMAVYQARAGQEFTLEIGVERLREYSLQQQATLREAMRSAGVACIEPEQPSDFGGFSLLRSEDAHGLVARLKESGVTADARGEFVRFGPDILNSTEELSQAAAITSKLCR